MEQFLQDVKKYLGEYITLTAEQREDDVCYKESKKEKEDLSGVDYALILNGFGVNIVDVCKTDLMTQSWPQIPSRKRFVMPLINMSMIRGADRRRQKVWCSQILTTFMRLSAPVRKLCRILKQSGKACGRPM